MGASDSAWLIVAFAYVVVVIVALVIRRLTLHSAWLSFSQHTLLPPFLGAWRRAVPAFIRVPLLDFLPALGYLSLPELLLILLHMGAVTAGFWLKLKYADEDLPNAEHTLENRADGVHVQQGDVWWQLALSAGPLAAGALFPVFLPIIRTRYYTEIIGIPFERRIAIHRIAARIFMIIAVGHGASVLVLNEFESLDATIMWTGIVALGLFWVPVLTSIEPIRRRFFDFFFRAHYVFLLALLFAVIHGGGAVVLGCIPFFAWAAFALLRVLDVFRNRTTLVSARTLPGDVVELVLEANNGWRPLEPVGFHCEPGQYVFLGDPLLGIELHPFTVARFAPESATARGRMTFLIKAATLATRPHEWTSELYNVVRAIEEADGDDVVLDSSWANHWLSKRDVATNSAGAVTSGIEMRYEAKFGSFSIEPRRYNTIVLVSGGIGVTPHSALLDALLSDDPEWSLDSAATAHIIFVWAARSSAPFETWIPDLLARAAAHPAVTLALYDTRASSKARVHAASNRVHPLTSSSATTNSASSYTEAQEASSSSSTSSTPAVSRDTATSARSSSSDDQSSARASADASLTILPGRPDLDAIIFDAGADGDSVGVFACGPQALVDSAERASRRHGHHFHKESFEF